MVKIAVFRHFQQFLLNISGNMNDREKKFIYKIVENVILRVLKKIIKIGSRVQELWSEKWSKWGAQALCRELF